MFCLLGGFQNKCSKSVTLGVKFQTMNTPMTPMQFICGNIVYLEFSKVLSHMSPIFLTKLIKVTFSAIFQYEQCYNTLIIENSQRIKRIVLLPTQLDIYYRHDYVDLYEQKPKAIKSFGIRISPLLESANIKPQNIEKHFTPNIPAWCMKPPKILFDLHSGNKI